MTSFLGVSVTVLLEEISIWFGRLSKENGPHQCGGYSHSFEQKGKERQTLSLLELEHPSPPASDIGAPGSWAFVLRVLT